MTFELRLRVDRHRVSESLIYLCYDMTGLQKIKKLKRASLDIRALAARR